MADGHFGAQHVHLRGHAVLEARAGHLGVGLFLLLGLRDQPAVALRPQQVVEGLHRGERHILLGAVDLRESDPSASTDASRSAVPTLPCVNSGCFTVMDSRTG